MIKIKLLARLAGTARKTRGSTNVRKGRDYLKVERWIELKCWLRDASLQQAADEALVSKECMSRYFRRVYGKGFLQWRKEARINEAKTLLLKEKEIPTAIIGEAVGINDKSNFRRQFKELTGMTPAQWRKNKKA